MQVNVIHIQTSDHSHAAIFIHMQVNDIHIQTSNHSHAANIIHMQVHGIHIQHQNKCSHLSMFTFRTKMPSTSLRVPFKCIEEGFHYRSMSGPRNTNPRSEFLLFYWSSLTCYWQVN